MKTFSKSQRNVVDDLTKYLSGELPEAAWERLEPALLDPQSNLTGAQKRLLSGLRQDELRLQADNLFLEDYKTDAPDPATLRTMVAGWSQKRSRKSASNLARWGLSIGAGLACLFLVISLLFSVDGVKPGPVANQSNPVAVEASVATPTVDDARIEWPIGVQISLLYPVKGRNILISQFDDVVGGKLNNGIDIAATVNTPIIAAKEGVVVSAGWQDDSAGNAIVINHNNNIYTRYSHLAKVEVVPGQTLTKGQEIGIIGTTGDAVGIHLHFELVVGGPDDKRINPLPYILNFLAGSRYGQPTPNP